MSKRFTKPRLSLSLLNPKVLVSLATATLLFTGCGGGGGSAPAGSTSVEKTGYLIDSAVKGIDYTCGTITGTTDITGKFTYDTTKCSSVEFSLGGLVLGSINPANINSDTKLTLQELAGTTREDAAHETVQKLAVLLQSLDSDGDPSNGIDINSTTRTNFALTGNLADKTDTQISQEITARGKTPKDKIQALNHLLTSTKAIAASTKIDLVPDAFHFTDLTNQALSSVVESAPITVAGIDIASPISVSGGYYKIGSGAWTNLPSKVTNGQTVTVRGTTSSNNATVTDINLTIGGVSDTFSIATIGDTIPTAFAFTDVSNIALSTVTESAPITVAGLGTGISTTISVTGGEYSINGGTYTTTSGTVTNTDTVKVRHTSSGTNNTATNTILTIGGLSDTFTTTTLVDTIPTAFTFTDVTNVALSTVTESNTITVAGLGDGVSTAISVTGGEYSINSGAYTATAGTVVNGNTVKVRHTSSASNDTNVTTTLTIGGVSDGFTTRTLPIAYTPASGSTNVGPYTWVKINFNKAMDSSTLTTTNLTLSGGKTFASCDYNSSTTTVICKLEDNTSFAENTLYTLSGTVKNSGGVDVVVDANFTTGSLNTFGRLRTGQTTSYATYDDGWYVTNQNLGLARSFDRNATSGHETVKDNVTKLIWQDDSSASSVSAIWADANSTTCQNLNTSTFGGYTDWRLPTIEELYTITNKGTNSPTKFSTFNNFASDYYWSSTTRASRSDVAWYVSFNYGYDYWSYKTFSYYVRCVRAGE